MITQIRKDLKYIFNNAVKTGVFTKEQLIQIKGKKDKAGKYQGGYISNIRKYLSNERLVNPPVGHIWQQVVGTPSLVRYVENLTSLNPNPEYQRNAGVWMVNRLYAALDGWVKPSADPPETFYLDVTDPLKTDQEGLPFYKVNGQVKHPEGLSQSQAALNARSTYGDGTIKRKKGHTKPERDIEALDKKNKSFWARVAKRNKSFKKEMEAKDLDARMAT